MTTRDFHKLRVLATRHPIAAAKSVCFDVPDTLAETFRWRPGQHITLRFHLHGQEVRRSYTISSAPCSGEPLRITVKRVKDGLVSNHINDTIKAGDEIEVMPPFGGFCLDPEGKARRTYYFFGAGSGITPLYAMLYSVLLDEPHSFAYLLYGNASEKSIIFQQKLAELAAAYPNRLVVRHMLSDQSWFSSLQPWRSGRVDADAIQAFIGENPPLAHDAQYYVCGPGTMNASVKAALRNIDVPLARIHSESFGGAVETDDSFAGIAAQATVTLSGQTNEVAVDEKQTILSALLAADVKPPYSCQAGICGACRAQITDGEVHMRARMALEESEIDSGAILTCQSVAKTSTLALTFE